MNLSARKVRHIITILLLPIYHIRSAACGLALGGLALFSGCQALGTAKPPEDPMQTQLTGLENAAITSRSAYLASLAEQQREEAAIEAAMPKPDLTQGPDVIPPTGGH